MSIAIDHCAPQVEMLTPLPRWTAAPVVPVVVSVVVP
jgi:hypothetical protein